MQYCQKQLQQLPQKQQLLQHQRQRLFYGYLESQNQRGLALIGPVLIYRYLVHWGL